MVRGLRRVVEVSSTVVEVSSTVVEVSSTVVVAAVVVDSSALVGEPNANTEATIAAATIPTFMRMDRDSTANSDVTGVTSPRNSW